MASLYRFRWAFVFSKKVCYLTYLRLTEAALVVEAKEEEAVVMTPQADANADYCKCT